MGPKKGKGKGKVAEEVVESPEQVEWRTLKVEADRLHNLTKKEEHDFNEFQQQREKLNYFWIVEKKKLEDKRADLRNKHREVQDLEEKHQVEIKIYKQRLKHLLHEHQANVTVRKTEAEVALKMAQDDDREQQSDIKGERRVVSLALREIELTHDEYVRGMKRDQDQKITFLRHEFERKANEVQKLYEARMKKTRDALDRRRKDEIKAIEDRKLVMIEQLMAEHQKEFTDIKNYYNDITHNNLDLIKSLKEEVKELEMIERNDQIRLNEKRAENKKLTAPLKKMQEDLVRLKSELEEYKKEKAEMRRVKALLVGVEEEHAAIVWEHETLSQRFAELKSERDELRRNFHASVFDVKQKSAFRSLLFEKKLAAMQRVQEEREAQLVEVLSRANLDPTVLGQVKGHIDDVLHRKNVEARQLQQEVARLQSLHEELRDSVANKLNEYGLTMSELGFDPTARSLAKTKRLLALTGASDVGPAQHAQTA